MFDTRAKWTSFDAVASGQGSKFDATLMFSSPGDPPVSWWYYVNDEAGSKDEYIVTLQGEEDKPGLRPDVNLRASLLTFFSVSWMRCLGCIGTTAEA